MKNTLFISLFMVLALSCQKSPQPNIIGPCTQKHVSGLLTPEVLWSFGQIGGFAVSPDGKKVLYDVKYYSIAQNKGNSELFVMDIDGSNKLQLTHSVESEYSASWSPRGDKIYYLSGKSGSSQLWEMLPNGKRARRVSETDGDITNYLISSAGDKILFTKDVKVDPSTTDLHPDLPLADGMVITDLMYRHWDSWEDGLYSHIFVADLERGKLTNEFDIMPSEGFDSPLMPFGGTEEICWSPDGKKIAYTCKKLKGKDYTLSTNSDIYLYDLDAKTTVNLTEGMPGYDKAPLFSNDGKKMAWLSMERPGFEADKDRLFVYDFETNTKTYHTKNFDYSPSSLNWTPDDKSMVFVAGIKATFQLFRINLENDSIRMITTGDHDYHQLALAGDVLVGSKVSMLKPSEIYTINEKTGAETEISFENKHLLDQLTPASVEKRWITTTDKQQMLTWVIYPPDFDKTKKYPTILYCEGGPQSPLSQFWSYRWNFSIMAANGYIVVAPNRRGVLTHGQAWTDQISGDHGGQNMKDYLSAIDAMAAEPFVDKDNMGCIGASYGGYSVYWLAGHHQKRFKAFIAHCGVFNADMEYATTDEMFFDNWENGGAFWETENKTAMKSYAESPHRFVQYWDTPILVIHGGLDFRIPYTQGMAAFNSAQLRGIPSKFLYFPTENHWVLKPQNGILWQRTFFGWLDQWLKPKA